MEIHARVSSIFYYIILLNASSFFATQTPISIPFKKPHWFYPINGLSKTKDSLHSRYA